MTAEVRYHRRHTALADRKRNHDDVRTEAQRDCDRILYYSKYFQRLAGKSQIISPDATHELTHDRKTHAEKVAQLAEALARRLEHKEELKGPERLAGSLDPAVTRAAAGAHDLGHPPFGHVGEEELDVIGRTQGLPEGFQANAQSYRIVCKLDVHPRVRQGLDLTYAVQHALLKYPWSYNATLDVTEPGAPDTTHYWGFYSSEFPDFDAGVKTGIRDGLRPSERTLEADVMDLADDMTFALHDFEDFFNLGELNLPELLSSGFWEDEADTVLRLETIYSANFQASEWWRAVKTVRQYLESDSMKPLRQMNTDSRAQENAMREFTSHWLTRWLAGTSLNPHGGLLVEGPTWHEVNVLKQMTWERVITRPALRISQEGDRRTVRDLAEMLFEAYRADPGRTPSRLRDLVKLSEDDDDWDVGKTDDAVVTRATLDYISWLTEGQALELCVKMSGRSTSSYGRTWIR